MLKGVKEQLNKYLMKNNIYYENNKEEHKLKVKEYREKIILDIQGGIRSTMTYIGAKKIKDIPKCTTFIRVNRQLNQIYNGREI